MKRNHTEIPGDEKLSIVILSRDLNIIIIDDSQVASLSKMVDPMGGIEDTLMLVDFALCSIKSERLFLSIHIPIDRIEHI